MNTLKVYLKKSGVLIFKDLLNHSWTRDEEILYIECEGRCYSIPRENVLYVEEVVK